MPESLTLRLEAGPCHITFKTEQGLQTFVRDLRVLWETETETKLEVEYIQTEIFCCTTVMFHKLICLSFNRHKVVFLKFILPAWNCLFSFVLKLFSATIIGAELISSLNIFSTIICVSVNGCGSHEVQWSMFYFYSLHLTLTRDCLKVEGKLQVREGQGICKQFIYFTF